MLTHNDSTVPNALEICRDLCVPGLRYVGFKDVGLPFERLKELSAAIHANGQQVMLEVVSESTEDELRSVRAALGLEVDYLLGGTHAREALDILDGAGIRYCPFPGRVSGHPSRLRGTIAEITASARHLASLPCVHGLDLLAYRYDGDVETLVHSVVAATTHAPVIAAGSVDSVERIRRLSTLGAWAFTIGGAIFEGAFGGTDVREQIETVLAAAGGV
ncbi:MAG: 4-hydroxythreonine-4-phosphate dehydrogenase [Acidobacteria bacterium]|nr:4-hydroxythreonine-4-phosphate dehydrogenase [Acidobacteriota bacterium]